MDLFRILVVDDHEAVRQRVRALLSSNAHWLVCGEAEDGPSKRSNWRQSCDRTLS